MFPFQLVLGGNGEKLLRYLTVATYNTVTMCLSPKSSLVQNVDDTRKRGNGM